MKQLLLVVCTGCVLLISAGCSAFFGNSGKVQTFTLTVPDVKTPIKGVAVDSFTSSSPAKYKMLIREGDLVRMEPRAKWVMPPEQMLSACYKQVFAPKTGTNPEKILSGDVLEFAHILPGKGKYGSAVLTVKYSVKSSSGTILTSTVLTDSEPVADRSWEAFAAAMNKAFVQQCSNLMRILQEK